MGWALVVGGSHCRRATLLNERAVILGSGPAALSFVTDLAEIEIEFEEPVAMYHDKFIVPAEAKIDLKDYSPGYTHHFKDESEAKEKLEEDVARLFRCQDVLYAQHCYSVLIVFQAMDAAGKDGTIKHVMSGLNPQGCQVTSFKAPSAEELSHDYLWRCVKKLPERGKIGVFNRFEPRIIPYLIAEPVSVHIRH